MQQEIQITDLLSDLEKVSKQIEDRKDELVTGSTTEFIKRFASISKSLRAVSIAERTMEEKAHHLLKHSDSTEKKLRKEQLKLIQK